MKVFQNTCAVKDLRSIFERICRRITKDVHVYYGVLLGIFFLEIRLKNLIRFFGFRKILEGLPGGIYEKRLIKKFGNRVQKPFGDFKDKLIEEFLEKFLVNSLGKVLREFAEVFLEYSEDIIQKKFQNTRLVLKNKIKNKSISKKLLTFLNYFEYFLNNSLDYPWQSS